MSFSVFTPDDYAVIRREYGLLKEQAAKRCANEAELATVQKAFDFANDAHKNVRRRSGEPYILHPIAVARIVVGDIGLGYKSICAALLHDVVEDTDYTTEDIRNLFGNKIATLVDGLTKIKTVLDTEEKTKQGVSYTQSLQAENFKRILLTLNDDVRVALIKLADRLHNCRTIEFMPEHKRDKILSETMFIFIPLAHRLGLYGIKTEMENIWLKNAEPSIYEDISNRINENVSNHQDEIESFMVPIEVALKRSGFEFEIRKRVKSAYSVWHKMQSKHIPFEQVYDLFAVRIIFVPDIKTVESERDQCYHIFSIISSLYSYKPDRLRDWVKYPKANGYEALHCTVMTPKGLWVEVQIRSKRMDDIAEKGIAAHWAYKKDGYIGENDNAMDLWLQQVKEILVNPDVNALDLLDDIHNDLTSSTIAVFTPKGDQKMVVKGATALDFAYVIHTEIGNKAIAAKVNKRLVNLGTVLHTGDQVEIITAQNGHPNPEWLSFLKSHRARSIVQDYLKNEKKLQSVQDISEDGNPYSVSGAIGSRTRFLISPCCHPIPGDPVVGFRENDGSITVHKKQCPVAEQRASTQGDRLVVPRWEEEIEKTAVFPVRISLSGIDRVGLLSEISHYISTVMGINIRKLTLSAEEGVTEGFMEVLVSDKASLDTLISKLSSIEGIHTVIRTDLSTRQ